ncbi:hypothetical protein KUTeg_019913 [Tegillarca granosa]|uniref:B(0,+)-type amino acid transporter 1 n=1 Tax=Tegillarca granosa TaxID=220873 RepID=A0ABQ9EDX8_TEGGR|nr:hypothetical protein KUTeg_019913 [Tegillarca granosa]
MYLQIYAKDKYKLEDDDGSDHSAVRLEKSVGLVSGTAMIVGTMIVILVVINCSSTKLATWIQTICTAGKLLAIAVISFGGIYTMATGSTEYIATGFEGTPSDFSLIAIAFYNGLWAFDGWNNLNFVTEELKNPKRNLPLSIIIGIPLTTVCYILVNVGYFSTWGDYVLGRYMSWIIPVFVIISCFGSANGCLFATGRLCFVAAREGHFPKVLSYIQVNRHTPFPSVIFTALIGMILIIPGDLSTLIDFFSFSAWIVPIVIPIIVFLVSLYLTISPIIQSPRMQFFYAFLFILSGFHIFIFEI